MESFNFELKLVSDVDRVARRGVDPLKKLESQGRKTQEALNFQKPLGRVEQQLARINKDPVGFVKLKKAQRELAEQQNKLLEGAGLKKGEGFMSGLTSKLNFSRIAGAAAVGEIIGEGVIKAGESLIEAAHSFVEVVQEGLAKAFEEAGKEQKLKRQFGLSLGTKEGKESLEDADRFAKLTKFTPEQIAPMLLKLRRAGFNQKSARQTIATGADIEAAGGLSTQEYAEFAEHLKLKGGVSTKQLVGAGINAPQFYKDLGKKLGISAGAAEKRASEGGKIDPQLMLNMITEAVNKKQGGKAGTGAGKEAAGFEARFAKVLDLPNQYLKKLDDMPGFQRASDMLQGLLEKLDPDSPIGKRIQAAIESMFDKITGMIGDPEDAADKLASTVEQVVHLFGEAIDAGKALADALLPSLDTVEDMLIGLRQFVALQSGDKAGFQAALQKEGEVAIERKARGFRKENAENKQRVATAMSAQAEQDTYDENKKYANHVVGGNVIPAVAPEGKGGKVIQLHVHPGAVVVHAGAGDDPDRAHHEVGTKLQKHVQRVLEQAAQEGGG